ncbi:MAG: tRNA (5-methylaminomethyl-2-thiouridine)(34)-methyltransferase MnmD [Cyclobacteriaceae bacterium]|jgi:tRNA U34 5-methylaminomethyl-2-thiouridine-forming methyltransferase MnmC|nr:tRNA (5-methylaminomethyl-2-thiouridine)(34)-methyltransferase MnmD [Cyclobacteriaceae bacterium]
MDDVVSLITTGDGSPSLLNKALDETYHSRHGALQESLYVFIDKGLAFLHREMKQENIRVLEIGFGTGLNAWLTHQYQIKNQLQIHYASLETFPLPENIYSLLDYHFSIEEKESFINLHHANWNEVVKVSENFTLEKVNQALQTYSGNKKVNLIYYDAFAPNKQPDMWTFDTLAKATSLLEKNGVFVTYCAKGQLKRDLKTLGLQVESLSGPPGKREMVRAIKM